MEKKITIAVYVVITLFALFTLRLWYLQIIRGAEYSRIDERNRIRIVEIPSPRGIIYDRNGKPLVKNIPSFDISILREDIPKDAEQLNALAGLLHIKTGVLKSRLKKATSNPFEPVKLKQDVSFREVAVIEARKTDFPGLQVEVVGGREYIYKQAASHVIGYLGRLSLEQLKAPEYKDVPKEAFIGQFGAEKVYDKKLRGIAGKKILAVDARGKVIKVVRILKPVKGEDIELTIDIDLQVVAEKSLQGKAGAVVAIDPDSGEVLALASAPSFNPNLFSRGIQYRDWKRLVNDREKPLLNRSVQSQYPPGSTFKIITAIAALQEGIISRDTHFYCRGSIFFGRTFRCWKAEGHGSTDLNQALVESCDVYFYEVGKKLDIDILAKYAFRYGLGSPTDIELEREARGIVPTREWKLNKKNEKWYTGETLNTVIGQGYLSATPVQMARLMAAVVNGGRLFNLSILKEPDGRADVERTIKITPEYIRTIKKALQGVVEDKHGTGRLAHSDVVAVGGKTGTTQVVGGVRKGQNVPERFRDHAWFLAFAPETKPEIAVAVFVEHGGHGSTGAAPVAKEIIETFFNRS
jgi:penicillin-binding protein 2